MGVDITVMAKGEVVYTNLLYRFLLGGAGIFLGILLCIIRIPVGQKGKKRIFTLSLFCLFNGVWNLTNPAFAASIAGGSNLMEVLWQMTCMLQLLSVIGLLYSITHAGVKTAVGILFWCTGILAGATVVCLNIHVINQLEFTYLLMLLTGIVCTILLAILIVEVLRKERTACEMLYSLFPVGIFWLTEAAFFVKESRYNGDFTQLGMLLFCLTQTAFIMREFRPLPAESLYEGQKGNMTDKRAAAKISQMPPHFLYHSLNDIQQLYDDEPQKGTKALQHFCGFLKQNMESLSDVTLIPFEKEMVHVREFLYLAKMRFGDRLNVYTEIKVDNFLLPSLALQSIVENAVQHGIMKKLGGGTVTIKTKKQGDTIVITVMDDGTGFDVREIRQDDEQEHLGIIHVKQCIEIQCGGIFQIRSRKGMGTVVTMILPQRRSTF